MQNSWEFLRKPVGPVRSWLNSLTEICLDMREVLRPASHFQTARDSNGWIIRASDRSPSRGLTTGETASIIEARGEAVVAGSQSLKRALRNAKVTIFIPKNWILQRRLERLPKSTGDYLDVFTRHNIEKLTPWRPEDVFFAKTVAPDEGKDTLTLSLHVVPRHFVAGVVAALVGVGVGAISLVKEGEEPANGETIAVPLQHRIASITDTRRILTRGLALTAAVFLACLAVLNWYQVKFQSEQEDIDRKLSGTRRFIQTATERRTQNADEADDLILRRNGSIPVVQVLEDLSRALPDIAYVSELEFDGGRLRISGEARDIATLIPSLEEGGSFSEVTFFAPSTRLTSGTGYRFYIEMGIVAARQTLSEARIN